MSSIHDLKLFGVAYWDVLGTLVAAGLLTQFGAIKSLPVSIVALFAAGFVAHRVFNISTALQQ